MDSADLIFTDFLINREKDDIVIRGKQVQDYLVKAGLMVGSLVIFALMTKIGPIAFLFKLSSISSGLKIIYSLLLFTFVIGVPTIIFLVLSEVVSKFVSIKFICIKSDNIEFKLEKLTFNRSDMLDIKIIEEHNQSSSRLYRLKYEIKNGEITSKFAITEYNKAQELADLIKNSS